MVKQSHQICVLSGTSDIQTVQDYGKGIFRISKSLAGKLRKDGFKTDRGTLWRIETQQNKRVFAVLRHAPSGRGSAVWMEYEMRRELGMTAGAEVSLSFRPAFRVEYILFLLEHCDPLIKAQSRVALSLTISSIIAGFVLGLMF